MGVGNKAKMRWGWAPHAQVGLPQSPLTRTPPSSTRSPWAGCWACGSQWRTPRWRMAASGSSPAPTPVRTPVSPCPLIPYPPWERDPEKREAEGSILVCRWNVEKDGPGPCWFSTWHLLPGVRAARDNSLFVPTPVQRRRREAEGPEARPSSPEGCEVTERERHWTLGSQEAVGLTAMSPESG